MSKPYLLEAQKEYIVKAHGSIFKIVVLDVTKTTYLLKNLDADSTFRVSRDLVVDSGYSWEYVVVEAL